MSVIENLILSGVGLGLIGASRLIADHFKIPGGSSDAIKFAGLGDSDWSRLYRWMTAMLTGCVLLGVGIYDLFS